MLPGGSASKGKGVCIRMGSASGGGLHPGVGGSASRGRGVCI